MQKRTALLVDGSNNYATVSQLGFSVDYDKLYKSALFEGIVFPYYFTALRGKEVVSDVRKLVDYLEYNGWTVVHKPTKEYVDDGKTKIKGNMDCELILTAVDLALQGRIDNVALFAGDGDYAALVKWLQAHGIYVTVFSSIKTPIPMAADELRRAANMFVDIADIRDTIMRVDNLTPIRTKSEGFLGRRKA